MISVRRDGPATVPRITRSRQTRQPVSRCDGIPISGCRMVMQNLRVAIFIAILSWHIAGGARSLKNAPGELISGDHVADAVRIEENLAP